MPRTRQPIRTALTYKQLEAAMSNELALTNEAPAPRYQGGSSALVDLRAAAMSVSSETMKIGLEEYADRRDTFRRWLLEQLKPGVHYGIPPGCEPKFDDDGNLQVWMKGGYRSVGADQWQHKPSFYQAGADFVIDLMNLRAEFAADLGAWEMLGKPQGKVVYKCQLFLRSNGELIGEGIGARTIGDKGGDLNNGVKMACKCAKVAAVINSYGLSDLFTQDMEDQEKTKHQNPAANPAAPKAVPRAERGSCNKERLTEILERYKRNRPDHDAEMLRRFCHGATGHSFMIVGADEEPINKVNALTQWTAKRMDEVCEKMDMEDFDA